MGDESRTDEARAWLHKAHQDLVCAQLIAAHQGPSTVGCYLGQQCMEKALKAVLVLQGEPAARTHDLTDLASRLTGHGLQPDAAIDDLRGWTDYAVAARYPGFGDVRADEDLQSILRDALRLLDWARDQLA